MDRKNYFEVLKLPFDPPDNSKVIRKRLEEWKNDRAELYANNRERLKEMLTLYDDMEKVLMTPKLCIQEAERLKATRLTELETLLGIKLSGLKKGLTPEVTTAQVCSVSNFLGLNTSTVEQLYREKGFRVQKNTQLLNINDYFFQPAFILEIEKYLDKFRNSNPVNYPWAKDAENLFDLICFFDGKKKTDTLLYRSKLTNSLCEMAKNFAIEASTGATATGLLLGKLFATASEKIFNNEQNRRKYENSLIMLRNRDFFTLLHSAPEGFKKDQSFAETCISTIQSFFPDRNLALTIYNAETGQQNDPYEPLSAEFYISCPSCFNTSRFKTREEAENAFCPACGNRLYIDCPNPSCRKKVPALARTCSCGFSLLEYGFTKQYLSFADEAIGDMEYLEAERQINNAKRANPYDPDIPMLESKLSESKKKYEQPLKELQELIDRQCYSQASRKLDMILGQNPELKLEGEKRLIRSRLEQAASNMPNPSLPKEEQAKQCFFITNFVRDYKPAVDIIKTFPPKQAKKLNVSLKDSEEGVVNSLSWQPADDFGITYRVMRKDGGIPLNPNDGKKLAGQLTETSYIDKDIVAGMRYGYAVFAGRYGSYSHSTSFTIETTFELDKSRLKMEYRSGQCSFHWNLPQNCKGVRVLRCKGGVPSSSPDTNTEIASEISLNDFVDSNFERNASYTYRLQCIYEFDGRDVYSQGLVTDSIVAEEPPALLQNISKRYKDNTVIVTWNETNKKSDTIIIRKVGDNFNKKLIGQQLSVQHADSVLDPQVLATCPSSMNLLSFPLNTGMSIKAALVSSTGKSCIICDVFTMAGVKPCDIDKENTTVENNTIRVVIKDAPKELFQFHYILNEILDKPEWGTEQDVIKGRSVMVSRDEYQRNGNMIIIPKVPEKELCLTVIGEYQTTEGNSVYTNPSNIQLNNKPKSELRYRITWSKGYLKRRPGEEPQLLIESDDGTMPDIYLSCLDTGEMPWSMTDKDLKVLYHFKSAQVGTGLTIPLNDFRQLGLKKGTILRIMINDDAMMRYVTVPADLNSLKVP